MKPLFKVSGAGALALLGQTSALTLSMFGTTYYDNVMSVFVLTALAILILNRERLRAGPPAQAAGIAGVAGLIAGIAMGLKLPEMPFCVGFAAALVALGGSMKQQSVRLLAGGIVGELHAKTGRRQIKAVLVEEQFARRIQRDRQRDAGQQRERRKHA